MKEGSYSNEEGNARFAENLLKSRKEKKKRTLIKLVRDRKRCISLYDYKKGSCKLLQLL